MDRVKRRIVVGSLTAVMLLAGAVPASATADPEASCVGIIASELATAGELDVGEFMALADALGAPNFGLFVAGGAMLHEGSLEACLPPTP